MKQEIGTLSLRGKVSPPLPNAGFAEKGGSLATAKSIFKCSDSELDELEFRDELPHLRASGDESDAVSTV